MDRSALLLIVANALLIGGCATQNPTTLLRDQPSVRSNMIRSSAMEPRSRPEDCYLDLVLDRNPVRPYVVVGRVSAVWIGTDEQALEADEEQALEALRAEACRAGGHALFRYGSSQRDQWIAHSGGAQRGSLVRTIRSYALVAVYVSPDGELLTPPTGPRQVIRVPAALPEAVEGVRERGIHPAWERGITDPWAVPAD